MSFAHDTRLVSVEIAVMPGPDEAAALAASLLAEAARNGEHVVLAGGSTPRRAYELAAVLAPDWSHAEIWLGDERCLPSADARTNAYLVEEALLSGLAAPPAAVHTVETALGADAAAAAYDADLRGVPLGLVLLGVGEDGHTASLFPGAPALDVRDRLAVAVEAGLAPFVPRVTLTIPALSSARRVVFLAVGTAKAEAVLRAFGQPPSPTTPASLVRSAGGTTTAILDEAAAARLRAGGTYVRSDRGEPAP
ncbi:MAG: 6-phosphogluconolactonase [Gaiellaceae bacterium]